MDELRTWFTRYLELYAAYGRGDRDDLEALLAFYAVPLRCTTGAGATVLATPGDVVAATRGQVDALRAEDYERSDVVHLEVEVLNATTALVRGQFVRRRGDGRPLAELEVTYLVVDGPEWRIAALVVHDAAASGDDRVQRERLEAALLAAGVRPDTVEELKLGHVVPVPRIDPVAHDGEQGPSEGK